MVSCAGVHLQAGHTAPSWLAADELSFILGPTTGEWEFGGFPAWLLAEEPAVTIRTYEDGYIAQVSADVAFFFFFFF